VKIQVASDLHLEFVERNWPNGRLIEPVEGAEVLVMAGDIHVGTRGFNAFADWPVPVVYLAGNHEFYRQHYDNLLREMRRLQATADQAAENQSDQAPGEGQEDLTGSVGLGSTRRSNMHFLEQDEYILPSATETVRFLGTTLWTDYALDGDPDAAMAVAGASLNDHRLIKYGDGYFTPRQARAVHRTARAWLANKLHEPFDGKTVVITHHGPHPLSVDPQYQGNALNPAFSSDLSELMGKAALWIHGHTHSSVDYVVNGTRVVANPAGYPVGARHSLRLHLENPNFKPDLLIEV